MYFCEELLHFFKDIVMKMSPSVAQQYTQEHLSALQAQRLAHEIAFSGIALDDKVWHPSAPLGSQQGIDPETNCRAHFCE